MWIRSAKVNKPKFGKKSEKKKSQMEIFKEEIKAKHEAAEALKAKQKEKAKLTGIPVDYNPNFNAQAISDQVNVWLDFEWLRNLSETYFFRVTPTRRIYSSRRWAAAVQKKMSLIILADLGRSFLLR